MQMEGMPCWDFEVGFRADLQNRGLPSGMPQICGVSIRECSAEQPGDFQRVPTTSTGYQRPGFSIFPWGTRRYSLFRFMKH